MIDFLIEVWTSMNDVEIFVYPVACCFLWALVTLFRSFFGRGVTV